MERWRCEDKMLHPANVTAPFTVRNLLNLNEFHPSYKDAVPTDCLTHMTSIHHHSIPNKGDENTNTLTLHEANHHNASYLYSDNARVMYMKNESNQHQHVNLSASTNPMLESPTPGKRCDKHSVPTETHRLVYLSFTESCLILPFRSLSPIIIKSRATK